MTKTTLIEGQVAQILNARELVINRGSNQGVRIGMKFAVIEPKALNIVDPETGQELGSVPRPKVQVQVITVQDNLSVARTYRSKRVNVGGFGLAGVGLPRMFEPPKYEKRYETFKSDPSTWEDLDEEHSYVKVGDPVEQIPHDISEG